MIVGPLSENSEPKVGCTMAEAAQVLGIAQSTAEEDWTYSKAWLRRQWFRGEQKKEAPG